jgi:hypothetical protein
VGPVLVAALIGMACFGLVWWWSRRMGMLIVPGGSGHPPGSRSAAIGLLVAATVLFAGGVAWERAWVSSPAVAQPTSAEGGTQADGDAHAEGATHAGSGLPVLGSEEVAAQAGVVTSLLLLAGLFMLWRSRPVLIGTVVLLLGFAALDLREVISQLGAARPPLAALAGLVTLLHVVSAAGLVVVVFRAISSDRHPRLAP